MIDYDVIVFVRIVPTFCFFKSVEQVYRDDDKAILIVSYDWYVKMRLHLLIYGRNVISEIQLIKPRTANMTYNGNQYKAEIIA